MITPKFQILLFSFIASPFKISGGIVKILLFIIDFVNLIDTLSILSKENNICEGSNINNFLFSIFCK